MIHLAKRVIRQTINDKRSVMMILVAPLLILTLVYFLLGDSGYVPTIGIDKNAIPDSLVIALEEQDLNVVDVTSNSIEHPKDYLKEHPDVDAIFTLSKNSGMTITMYEPSTKGAKAASEIQTAMGSLHPSAEINMSYVYGTKGQSSFDSLGYVFLALFSFFLVFIISGMALVRERSGGTLERLLMTPIKRGEVILGYTLGYGVFAIVQAIIIVLYSIFVLQLSSVGNIGWILLTMVLLAVTAVSFGATISIFASSELQVVQMIPFTIIPQVFFSGLIPLDLIPYQLGNLCYIMPIYYGAAAIKGVMVYGDGFMQIWGYLLGLILYAFLLYLLNTQALKKFRKL
ncbi:ABC transporter permease [Bacillus luteolus]|uniref:ABC transporter permease n=1 Tax=Litchfieldia luteola TaxID=682179 RepID=A0ABR9QKZ8_9BACI|nr:ABC transporter permease [Cytobacillus luteolus]MBE4909176.1 ABC transporter permease [Cytobacillus luteolus]MBP1940371.1 ABC-2 type transport system permease protein [Cytobacillus luteolus]